MKKIVVSLLLLVGVAIPSQAAYTGRVFVDRNRNGIYDSGEKALENVLVSDGLHVVRTAANGLFSLPGHEKMRFVFITTPSGYQTNNRYYLPVQGEQKAYNFGLEPFDRTGSGGSHRFIHLSDTEIFNTTNHEDWIKNVRDYARNEAVSFIVHTGDICYEKGLTEHIDLMNTKNMGCPVFYTLGNHDLVKGNYGEELFEQLYGPVYYSFDFGSVHYIVTPMLSGDHAPSYTKEDVYRWLKNDLAMIPKGKPVVVFCHDLLTDSDRFLYGISDTETVNLNSHNLKAWLYGHWHINYMKKQGNVYTVSTGSLDKGGIDHSTNAFRVMHVDARGGVASQLRYTYLDKHLEIASPGEDGYPFLMSGALPLTVNVYHSTSPTKEVVYSCSVDGKKFVSGRKLTQRTDWAWTDFIYLTHKPMGKRISVKVNATFNSGEKAEKEIHFTYNGRKPIVLLEEDWRNLLGNAEHQGISRATVEPPLRMVWTSNIGANSFMASPLIHQGKVFVASVDEDLKGKAAVYALDAQTGNLQWKYFMDNSIKNTIVADEGVIIAQTAQGSLTAVKAGDGSLKWGRQLLVNGRPALIDGLVVSDGVLYAGSGTGLCAVNAQTGDVLWQNEDWQQGEGTTATPTLANGMLIGSAQWKGLYGNDIQTGKMKWSLRHDGISNRGASPSLYNNILYVTGKNSLFIIQPETGNVIVRKEYPFSVDVTSTPLVTDKEIVFGTATEGLVAVDRETLEVKWKCLTGDALLHTAPYVRTPASTVETSPVLIGNTVYFGGSDGRLYGVNKETGEVVWQYATGAPFFGSVSASGNTLFAVDFGGNVYAFTNKLP